jgi:hypothetical protein
VGGLLLLLVGLVSCSLPARTVQVSLRSTATPTPFQPVPPTATFLPPSGRWTEPPPQPTLTFSAPPGPVEQPSPPTPIPPDPGGAVRIWADPLLPDGLRHSLLPPPGAVLTSQRELGEIRLEVGAGFPVSEWVYAAAAPFPIIPEGVSLFDLQQAWQGVPSGPFAGRPLFMDSSTQAVFSSIWGAPDPAYVRPVPAEDLLERAWAEQPSWALLPFEHLEAGWKVLEVDGQSPLWKSFEPKAYPLTVTFSLQSEVFGQEYLSQAGQALALPSSNRQADRLTTLVMTGVTAMVRCTAATMERSGFTYPAEEIREVLVGADLTHISNEVPFSPNCPRPACTQPDLIFCSAPGYIELLEDIGTDIIELTGDHFADYGASAMYYTLEMYRERGWGYYGGGENREEALRPLLVEHNGNKLAFLGCNGKAAYGFATASESQPGAVRCDWPYMLAEISRLRDAGYLPVVTFQHDEYYTFTAAPRLQEDFRRSADAGALIVSGSQAHQPHGMEFFQGGFLHYGLGNLFFDQFGFCAGDACSKALIDRHIFYENRYISTELLAIQFIDFARTRWMTEQEKRELLEILFSASGW